MTEKEIYVAFCTIFGFGLNKAIELPNGDIAMMLTLSQQGIADKEKITTCGYDWIETGALFDKQGGIIKAYIDSHVAYSSANYNYIEALFPKEEE